MISPKGKIIDRFESYELPNDYDILRFYKDFNWNSSVDDNVKSVKVNYYSDLK